jgi:hypothetical protein
MNFCAWAAKIRKKARKFRQNSSRLATIQDDCLSEIEIDNMKLPAHLLAALLVGIAVQTAASCTKAKETPNQKAAAETKAKTTSQQPDACIACGMG